MIPSFRSRSMTPSGGARRGHGGAPMGSSTSGGRPISPTNNSTSKIYDATDPCPAAAVADAGVVAAAPVFTEGAFLGDECATSESVLKVLKVLKLNEDVSGAEDTDGRTNGETTDER